MRLVHQLLADTERHFQRVLGGCRVRNCALPELRARQGSGHRAGEPHRAGKGLDYPPAHEQTSLGERPLFPAQEHRWDVGETGIWGASGAGRAVKIQPPVEALAEPARVAVLGLARRGGRGAGRWQCLSEFHCRELRVPVPGKGSVTRHKAQSHSCHGSRAGLGRPQHHSPDSRSPPRDPIPAFPGRTHGINPCHVPGRLPQPWPGGDSAPPGLHKHSFCISWRKNSSQI